MDASTEWSPAASSWSRFGSLYSVMEHIAKYGWYWNARNFVAMQMAGDQPSIYDLRFKKYCYSVWVPGLSERAIVAAEGRVCCDACMNQRTRLLFVVIRRSITSGSLE